MSSVPNSDQNLGDTSSELLHALGIFPGKFLSSLGGFQLGWGFWILIFVVAILGSKIGYFAPLTAYSKISHGHKQTLVPFRDIQSLKLNFMCRTSPTNHKCCVFSSVHAFRTAHFSLFSILRVLLELVLVLRSIGGVAFWFLSLKITSEDSPS